MGLGCSSVVECLPSRYDTLCWIPGFNYQYLLSLQKGVLGLGPKYPGRFQAPFAEIGKMIKMGCVET
jgi:hypothetical protein